MRAAVLSGPRKILVKLVPDPQVKVPTDAIVRVVAAGICETDVRRYEGYLGTVRGQRCGHEFVGVVAGVGAEVTKLRVGMVVVAPATFGDGCCPQCSRDLVARCDSGGMFGVATNGGQAEGVRVPFADATLIEIPMDEHDERLPAVLTLSDVMATGHHMVVTANAGPAASYAVVEDGAAGLCTVLAAERAGASRIFFLTDDPHRAKVAATFGATDLLPGPGETSTALVEELTGGQGVDVVVVSTAEPETLDVAGSLCRRDGTMAFVDGSHLVFDPMRSRKGITVTGEMCPVRTYLPGLLDEVVAGTLDPSPVFDHSVPLAAIASGYEKMASQEAAKVLVTIG